MLFYIATIQRQATSVQEIRMIDNCCLWHISLMDKAEKMQNLYKR